MALPFQGPVKVTVRAEWPGGRVEEHEYNADEGALEEVEMHHEAFSSGWDELGQWWLVRRVSRVSVTGTVYGRDELVRQLPAGTQDAR